MAYKACSFDDFESPDKLTHTDLIASWFTKRGLELPVSDQIPKNGSIVSYLGVPVALCGIRECEGAVGLIDSFVTDPDMPPEIRNEASDLLTAALIEQAHKLGMMSLIGMSKDAHTLIRSLRHGFQASNQVLVTRKLGG